MAIPIGEIDKTISIFNLFHQRSQFTYEVQTSDSSGFLDLRINLINNVVVML